jgi:hypothetical protein
MSSKARFILVNSHEIFDILALCVFVEFMLSFDILQGYVVYSTKYKLKKEYIGLSGNEIKNLKVSGVEITDSIITPEVAFTGDTTSDFVVDETNADALKAKVLVMESTFLDDSVSVEHARDYGHIHISEVRILLSLTPLVTFCLLMVIEDFIYP